jgi:hypothetical protein
LAPPADVGDSPLAAAERARRRRPDPVDGNVVAHALEVKHGTVPTRMAIVNTDDESPGSLNSAITS